MAWLVPHRLDGRSAWGLQKKDVFTRTENTSRVASRLVWRCVFVAGIAAGVLNKQEAEKLIHPIEHDIYKVKHSWRILQADQL